MNTIHRGLYKLHIPKLNDIDFIYQTPNSYYSLEMGKLYLGSHFGVNHDYFRQYKIKSMLTIMEGSQFYKMNMQNRIKDLYKSKILSSNKHLTSLDYACDQWKGSSNFIDEQLQNTNIFVHCVFGKSRSPSTVSAYLIAKHKYTPKDAIQLIESKRNIIID